LELRYLDFPFTERGAEPIFVAKALNGSWWSAPPFLVHPKWEYHALSIRNYLCAPGRLTVHSPITFLAELARRFVL
jgi:hypothetical protein